MSNLAWLAIVLGAAAVAAVTLSRPQVTAPAPRLGAVVEVLPWPRSG